MEILIEIGLYGGIIGIVCGSYLIVSSLFETKSGKPYRIGRSFSGMTMLGLSIMAAISLLNRLGGLEFFSQPENRCDLAVGSFIIGISLISVGVIYLKGAMRRWGGGFFQQVNVVMMVGISALAVLLGILMMVLFFFVMVT